MIAYSINYSFVIVRTYVKGVVFLIKEVHRNGEFELRAGDFVRGRQAVVGVHRAKGVEAVARHGADDAGQQQQCQRRVHLDDWRRRRRRAPLAPAAAAALCQGRKVHRGHAQQRLTPRDWLCPPSRMFRNTTQIF